MSTTGSIGPDKCFPITMLTGHTQHDDTQTKTTAHTDGRETDILFQFGTNVTVDTLT